MQFVPWRHVASWSCLSCGECCKLYSVVINFHEWLRIVKSYGAERTAPGLDKLFLKRKSDGSCVFLQSYSNVCTCALQYMKPKACQLWPFKVLTKPAYGFANEAFCNHNGQSVYVYVDPMCNGVRYGPPTWEFAHQTLKEFVQVAMGLSSVQFRTTGNAGHLRPNIGFGLLDGRSPF